MNDSSKRSISTGETRRMQCALHGEFEARHVVGTRWTVCPQCVAEDERAALEYRQQMKDRERQERLSQHIAAAGLRGRFLETTLDTFNTRTAAQRKAVEGCRRFVQDIVPGERWGGLWLLGPVGTGKTHLLAGMVSATIWQRGMRAQYITARGLVLRLRATWRRDAEESEQDVLDDLARVPLLAIDEIGVGFGTEAEMVQLLDVVDARYQLRRPIVLASNLDPAGLRTLLGDRLYDRLREGAQVLACEWPSHRGQVSSGASA